MSTIEITDLRAIDAQIAEKVFGRVGTGILHYSSQWAAAGQVVERMRERGWSVSVTSDGREYDWRVDFDDFGANAELLPLAVCLAALRAIAALEASQ